MAISTRLKTIADFIEQNSIVFDVGADHGILENYLLDNNRIKKIYAIENKKGPFNILSSSLKNNKNAICIFSDGLQDLKTDCDTIIVAGMGAHLISKIVFPKVLEFDNVKSIIVDSHNDLFYLRSNFVNNGFKIEKEKIVFENNHFYFVIKFIKGIKEYKKEELEFGYKIKEDPLFSLYKEKELSKINDLLFKVKDVDDKKIKTLLERKELLEKLWKQINYCEN